MRKRCGLCVFVICLTVLTSFPVQAADLFGWLRQWEVEMSIGNTPRITAPANGIILTNGSRYWSFYTKPVDQAPELTLNFTINAPLVQKDHFVLGVGCDDQLHVNYGKGSTWHLYARTNYGVLRPFVTAGLTVYRHSSNYPDLKDVGYSSPAIALSAGLQLRPVKNFYLQTAFTYTSKAVITNHNFSYYGEPVKLPEDYQQPAFTYHPNASIYIGGGFCFNFLPTMKGIRESLETGRAAKLDQLIKKAVDKDIPSKYRNFTVALVENLATTFDASVLTEKNAGAYWRAYDNTLVMHLISPTNYFRNYEFVYWMNEDTEVVDNLYKDFEKDVSQKVIAQIGEHINKYATVPPRIFLLIEFESYDQTRPRKELVWDENLRRYVFIDIEGELCDFRHYLAKIEMQVNKDEPSGYKVLTVQTHLVPSGKVSALGEF